MGFQFKEDVLTDKNLTEKIDALKLLAMKYPGKDDYEIYLLDQVERLLTNSRDQTKYLKNISTIISWLIALAIIGWIITLIFG